MRQWSQSLTLCLSFAALAALGGCVSVETGGGVVLAAEATDAPTAVLNTAAANPVATQQRFEAWKQDFTRRAIDKGYPPALLAATVGQARINERALERDRSQPEFTRPVWSYIQSAASPDRINRGQAELAEHKATFDELERIFGVPP